MDFESYLISKRIDSARFNSAEPEVWQSWRSDFEQMHPNSFTVQKLNLINPIRRKYQLTVIDVPKVATPKVATPKVASPSVASPSAAVPSAAKAPVAPDAKPAFKVPRPGMIKAVGTQAGSTPVKETPTDASSAQQIQEIVSSQPTAGAIEQTNTTTDDTTKPTAGINDTTIVSDGSVHDQATHTDDSTHSDNLVKPANVNTPTAGEAQNKDAESPNAEDAGANPVSESPKPVAKPAKPVIPRPVIKPKPKTN